jgi:hypothetical protein
VSLVANVIEGNGIPTLSIGTVRDIMSCVRAPRSVFVDYPVCRTFGRPHARRKQKQVLFDALHCLPLFKKHGQIVDLPHRWQDKSGKDWQEIIDWGK